MAMSHGLRICSDDGRPVDLSSWEANHAALFIIVRQGTVLACLPIRLKHQPPQALEQHTQIVESVKVAVNCSRDRRHSTGQRGPYQANGL